MKREIEIQREILDYLSTVRGARAWLNNAPSKYKNRYRPAGRSDIVGVYFNVGLFIEVKKDGGRVEPEQQAFLDDMRSLGHIAFVARSVEDVKEVLVRERAAS